jgi:predicted HTH domain antitoxin
MASTTRRLPEEERTMSLTVAIDIPREVLYAARMTPEEMKRELALWLFQQGKLAFGKARELAGMPVWAFQQLLGSRGIAVHYDVADYEEDLATLKTLGRL